MGFAGAAIAKCDDVFTTLDVFTTRQFQLILLSDGML